MPDVNNDVLFRGQERSIEHLQELYTVVAAVAVALAGEQFAKAVPTSHWLPVTPLVLAFVFTLVPFSHGTLLHLDKVYRKDPKSEVDDYSRLLVDYGFLLSEACLLILAAIYVRRARPFAVSLAALLTADIVWTAVVRVWFSDSARDIVTEDWSRINLVCLPFVAVPAALTWTDTSVTLVAMLIFGAAAVRTAVDYGLNPAFYRGKESVTATPAKDAADPDDPGS